MDGDDAAGEPLEGCALQPRRGNHVAEAIGMREAANRFDEIAVGVSVAGDELPEGGDSGEGISLVDPVEQRYVDIREFEAQKAAAVLQDAAGLGERAVDPRHVTDAEGNRIAVEGIVRERQGLRIAGGKNNTPPPPPMRPPPPAAPQQFPPDG